MMGMIALNCAWQNTKEMTTINEVIQKLEIWAPLSLQETYDNSGLIVGNGNDMVSGVLIALDCTEDIVEEANAIGCNLIVVHHPIVFAGLKKLNGRNYVERTVIKAIKHDVAIYAIHTALDNIKTGVNRIIGTRLGVDQMKILRPKKDELLKLVVYTPMEYYRALESALFDAGAGKIGNYDQCVFTSNGSGSFRPLPGANPHEGSIGVRNIQDEVKLEVLVAAHLKGKVSMAMIEAHPYEELAHEWIKIENVHQELGAGMVGKLPQPMSKIDFLQHVKIKMACEVIKYTKSTKEVIEKVAWCGGSGDFLLEDAIAQGADVFITSDFKYHRFFDHNERIIICDIGHFETESCVIDLLNDWFTEKFTTFAIHKTEIVTNPVNYYF